MAETILRCCTIYYVCGSEPDGPMICQETVCEIFIEEEPEPPPTQWVNVYRYPARSLSRLTKKLGTQIAAREKSLKRKYRARTVKLRPTAKTLSPAKQRAALAKLRRRAKM